MKSLANYITFTRMILTCVLFFLYPFSLAFFIVYILCGLTDILDGFIARRLHIETSFGAKLDTFADFLFVFVVMLRLVPVLFHTIELKMWMWALIVVIIKLLSAGIIYLKYDDYGMLHTYMNKLAGLLLLLSPFFINTYPVIVSWTLCIVTTLASVEELLINLCHNDLNLNRKSLFGDNVKRRKKKHKIDNREIQI